MDEHTLKTLLQQYKQGAITETEMMAHLNRLPFDDLGYACLDSHRALRNGYPEVIYGAGKSDAHLKGILTRLLQSTDRNILVTRLSPERYAALDLSAESGEYHADANLLVINRSETPRVGSIAVVTAGTSDIGVAEEAAVTAEIFGNRVTRIYDVGVAGLHRTLARLNDLTAANVLIVIAGMDGALPSVIGGLVARPVIAVPTSVGYGASFGGVSALLAMLNSCASGVSVVNIDNGFGAAYTASMINHAAAEAS